MVGRDKFAKNCSSLSEAKRKRTIESVFAQYLETVRPMHDKFVEPTKTYADIIVMDGGKNKMALDIINNKLLPIIKDKVDAYS